MLTNASIAIICDTDRVASDLRRLGPLLGRVTRIDRRAIETVREIDANVVIADIDDLSQLGTTSIATAIARICRPDQPIIFVISPSQRRILARSGALTGNNVVQRPLDEGDMSALVQRLVGGSNAARTAPAPVAAPLPRAVEAAAQPETSAAWPGMPKETPRLLSQAASMAVSALADVFAMAGGTAGATPISLGSQSEMVVDAIKEFGLNRWMKTVRTYHDGTYQHCMLVMGWAVAFGNHVGFSNRDLQRVAIGSMLHDLGKIAIPNQILDKPGRLTPDEFKMIRQHPEIGYRMLEQTERYSAEMLDLVLSHHEYLDGSGYPHGKSAGEISDLCRVTTIADIFAALVEDRPYRAPMTNDEAYDILLGMRGKLDMPLVKAHKTLLTAA
jgi:HD-GYP domain-containing protein (c-di-GMP phosphodiesterase class II)